tara:strand:+ start:1419 stop:1625 length:207 start_codon:yes stop_codon:yes gene_type:complete
MKDKKYDVFNMQLGQFEDSEIDPEDLLKSLTTQIVQESERMFEIYKAEKEIVSSILSKAIETDDRSTD